jgi:three-Cys-motif partner protein
LKKELGEHEFGGVSTDLKLSLVEGYLRFFTTALKGRFELWYIDAFAGTGERTVKHAGHDGGIGFEPAEARVERLKGSARIALDTRPSFDRIVFIDANKRHVAALEQLAGDRLGKDVEVVRAKANEAVMAEIARKDWSGVRAVMFLDPYGMHVDWTTLQGIASTKAIDVWYLVSLSGLFRQATKDGRALSEQKRNAICRMLGTTEWEGEWYGESGQVSLFGDIEPERFRIVSVGQIEAYVRKRLRTIFPSVSAPLTLRNSQNVPMFSLFFAVSNPEPKAIGLATKIANHLLKAGSSSQVRSK